jgi:acyl carrier protein
MTREEIIEKVKGTLAEEFEVDESVIQPEAVIYETLQLDSLSLVDLVAVVQYTFKVKIPAEELPTIKTFAQLYDYIESHAA